MAHICATSVPSAPPAVPVAVKCASPGECKTCAAWEKPTRETPPEEKAIRTALENAVRQELNLTAINFEKAALLSSAKKKCQNFMVPGQTTELVIRTEYWLVDSNSYNIEVKSGASSFKCKVKFEDYSIKFEPAIPAAMAKIVLDF